MNVLVYRWMSRWASLTFKIRIQQVQLINYCGLFLTRINTCTYSHTSELLHKYTHTRCGYIYYTLSNIYTYPYLQLYVQCWTRPMRCFREDSRSKYTMLTSSCLSPCSAPSSPPPCHWKYSRCVRYSLPLPPPVCLFEILCMYYCYYYTAVF